LYIERKIEEFIERKIEEFIKKNIEEFIEKKDKGILGINLFVRLYSKYIDTDIYTI